jgi:ACR3 family arsenite efflux pump ArsB
MGFFERYLSLWVLLDIVLGVGEGSLLPDPFHSVAAMEMAQVNLPVALPPPSVCLVFNPAPLWRPWSESWSMCP